jgi:predicted dehydrogenase
MIKLGVIGAGHLGKIHIKLALELNEIYNFVGFFDADATQANTVAAQFGIAAFSSIDELIDACDCLDIVTPTITHYEIAAKAIKKGKHVFIEKPITQTVEEAYSLLELSKSTGVTVQVGHVERFNPAFVAAAPYFKNPMFIETHRLAQFNPRGTDVPVILDLMIHDLDIVLHVVNSPVARVSASGVAVVSDTPDIANARIEFENGCVANLTASRISLKNMRKSRFFQKDAYISVDFLEKELEVVQMEDVQGEPGPFDMVLEIGNGKPAKKILFDKPEVVSSNAIKEELRTFANAIQTQSIPIVSLENGLIALEVAEKIMQCLKVNQSKIEL